jgi:hypothetical protein
MNDGVVLILPDTSLEDFRKGYEAALAKRKLLDVVNGNGKKRVVNPNHIVYFEEAEEDATEEDHRLAGWEEQFAAEAG